MATSTGVDYVSASGNLVFERSSFITDNKSHEKFIINRHFNHSVSIIAPGMNKPSVDSIKQLVETNSFKIYNIPLYELLEDEFIGGFLKNGSLHILSDDTHLDTDSCVALLPSGLLVLNLTKDMYESLGLEGKPSNYCLRKKVSRYVVHIDLKQSNFTQGNKYYERVKTCFHKQTDLQFNLLVHWKPPDDKICPTSIKCYFEKRNYKTITLPVEKVYRPLCNLKYPVIDSQHIEESESSCSYLDIFEWLGCVACDVDLEKVTPESYLSVVSCPSPHRITKSGCFYQVKGYFSSTDILHTLNKLRTNMSDFPDCPWICLAVHGYLDCPVSSGSKERGFYEGGENLYSYIIFPDQSYWLYTATDLYDMT